MNWYKHVAVGGHKFHLVGNRCYRGWSVYGIKQRQEEEAKVVEAKKVFWCTFPVPTDKILNLCGNCFRVASKYYQSQANPYHDGEWHA